MTVSPSKRPSDFCPHCVDSLVEPQCFCQHFAQMSRCLLFPSMARGPPALRLLPGDGSELQSRSRASRSSFLFHILVTGLPPPFCTPKPPQACSLPGGLWALGGQTQGGDSQAGLWAGSHPRASPPTLSFTGCLGKSVLSQESHRVIGPLANGLLGFLKEVGED